MWSIAVYYPDSGEVIECSVDAPSSDVPAILESVRESRAVAILFPAGTPTPDFLFNRGNVSGLVLAVDSSSESD